jgi:hypothetical protein
MNKRLLGGVESIFASGTSRVFRFAGLPATTACLDGIKLTLESSYSYSERPIKFAQGNGTVEFRLPLPPPLMSAKSNPSPPKDSKTSLLQLILVDASTDRDIGPLTDGTIIDVSVLPSINVRADWTSRLFPAGSVMFSYNGEPFSTEKNPPFVFNGHNASDYFSWKPYLGVHTITAAPFIDKLSIFPAGKSTLVTFSVVDNGFGNFTVANVSSAPKTYGVTGLFLVNAHTEKTILQMTNGTVLKLSALPTKDLNIQAFTRPYPTGRVRFSYDKAIYYQTETVPPYLMGTDWARNLTWQPTLGQHRVTATAYDSAGNERGVMTVNFAVIV